jgi:hypothetical protein
MPCWRPFTLLAFLIAAGPGLQIPEGLAETGTTKTVYCLERQLTFAFNPLRVSQALEQVPGLRAFVLEIMDDPLIPRALKNVIKRGLGDSDIDVVNLTEEIRKAWNIPDTVKAFMMPPIQSDEITPTWIYVTSHQTFNENATRVAKPKFKADYGVAVSDRPISHVHNDLIKLIHELAHVRFQGIFMRRFEQICQKLPPSYVNRLPNGQWRISGQLRDLLHEKYAHQIEIELLSKTHGRYFQPWENTWKRGLKTAQPSTVTTAVGEKIASIYAYSDPQVVALMDVPLSKIMLGGPAVKEVDEALRFYSIPEVGRPAMEELPVSLGLLRLIRHAEGKRVSGVPEIPQLKNSLSTLLNSDDGVARASKLLFRIFSSAESSNAARREVLAILNQPTIRQLLNSRGGWALPIKSSLNWEDVIQGHSITKQLFQDGLLPNDHESQSAMSLLSYGFRSLSFDLRQARGSQSLNEALDALSQAYQANDIIHSMLPLLKSPLREAKENLLTHHNALKDWNHVVAFWKRLGLESPFLRHYESPETFWNSNESLIGIYEKLKMIPSSS